MEVKGYRDGLAERSYRWKIHILIGFLRKPRALEEEGDSKDSFLYSRIHNKMSNVKDPILNEFRMEEVNI
jgi:hypothetical protein